MISWIVASHDPTVLYSNLVASLLIDDEDELVLVENPTSIASAYSEGQARATRPIRCYVHHDVQILDLPRLREALRVCPDWGVVGVIGCRDERIPWWDGSCLGSVFDGRIGALNFGPGGECSMLDGLLLATSHEVEWDLDYPGFHGYDHDMCSQMLARGFRNFCLTDGHQMLRHNTSSSSDPDQLVGWNDAVVRYKAKWGVA